MAFALQLCCNFHDLSNKDNACKTRNKNRLRYLLFQESDFDITLLAPTSACINKARERITSATVFTLAIFCDSAVMQHIVIFT